MLKSSFLFACLMLAQLFAQEPEWLPRDKQNQVNFRQEASNYLLFETNPEAWKALLQQAPANAPFGNQKISFQIHIPGPDGDLQAFYLWKSQVMAPELAAKYPEILSFSGYAAHDPRITIKVDVNPEGFHAMVRSHSGNWALEPAFKGNRNLYMVFREKDTPVNPSGFACQTSAPQGSIPHQKTGSGPGNPSGSELRTYRIAIATLGEFAVQNGGTKASALAALVLILNRINSIFERDFTINFQLVPNNDTIIYLNPATDPYFNSPGAMYSQNPFILDSLIGHTNYDIGHALGTGGSGVAILGSTCTPNKARGASLTSGAAGSFESVRVICHEIGHQLGAYHTFNFCSGQALTPYEPGSGITIMGYAGLCTNGNLTGPILDQFHVATFDYILDFVKNGAGNSCVQLTPTGNTPPSVTMPDGGFTIPRETPFELTGSATDPDGDSLTYCWEQWDTGPTSHPNSPVGTAPLFRSWSPKPQPTRIFPRIEDLVRNVSTIGEKLPPYGREMNFRMTVRDNHPGAGGVDYGLVTFEVSDSAGPFALTFPNGGQFLTAGDVETVTWDVAKTDLNPINCQHVEIWMSADSGYTYPYLLGSNRPNTGSTQVTIPNLNGLNYRMKVKAADHIFFDISDQKFGIIAPSQAHFSLAVINPVASSCNYDTANFTLQLGALLNFTDPVTLSISGNPPGSSISFDQNPVSTPATVNLSISSLQSLPFGDYPMTLTATASSGTRTLPLTLRILPGNSIALSLSSPGNGQSQVPLTGPLQWNPLPNVQDYLVEGSEDPNFQTLAFSTSVFGSSSWSPPSLTPHTIYFWRVAPLQGQCGPGNWSPTFSFQTEYVPCQIFTSVDTPIFIPSSFTPTVYSELEVNQNVNLSDVKVRDLHGIHYQMGDLRMTLFSPAGDSVDLFSNVCFNTRNFDVEFDDAAASATLPCPPINGMSYRPLDPLNTFAGSNGIGIWKLRVQDTQNYNGGYLNGWALELCSPAPNPFSPNLNSQLLMVNQGATGWIDSTYMQGDCGGLPSGLSYRLITLPAHGLLQLNGVNLSIGDSITQTQINNGSFSYVHDNGLSITDQFQYTATCDQGGFLGGLTFPIAIQTLIANDYSEGRKLQVYPNPANDRVRIVFSDSPSTTKTIFLTDLLGRRVLQLKTNSQASSLDLSQLPNGLYILEVRDSNGLLGAMRLEISH